jgi:Ca2+-binding RTX toxin-like protein
VTFLHYDVGDFADGGAGSLDVLNLSFGGEDNKSGDVIGSAITNFERVNLHGGGGNDTLTGLDDIDQLFGDDGGDILTGAGGNDTLTGGAGGDTFKYTNVSSGNDTITDFIHASDVIDVNAIDADTGKANDQDFAFVSAQNSGTVANSITWFQDTPNNQTVIQADNTGDTTADLTIVLQGKVDLTAADFHL